MAQLAHLNIARMNVAWDDPAFADFRDALEPVNRSADASPGFIWRLESAEDDSPELVAFENEGWLVNLSCWTDVDALKSFVRSPGHLAIMKRRSEWFTPVEVRVVLWWIEDGERPRFQDAVRRLEHLRTHGPTQAAFGFSQAFAPLPGPQAPCYPEQSAGAGDPGHDNKAGSKDPSTTR